MAWKSFRRSMLWFVALFIGLLAGGRASPAQETARATIVRAILTPDDKNKREIVTSLTGQGDEVIRELFAAWRQDSLFIFTTSDGAKIPVQLTGDKDAKGSQAAVRVDNGEILKDATGQ